jgi:hypothetical protein
VMWREVGKRETYVSRAEHVTCHVNISGNADFIKKYVILEKEDFCCFVTTDIVITLWSGG